MTGNDLGSTTEDRGGAPEDYAARAVAALQAGDPASAEAAARAGLAAAPDDQAWMRFTLGWVLQESGRPAEAEAEYRRAISLDPDYASAHHNLGNTLRSLGRPEAAIPAYQRTLEIEPDHPRVHDGLARAFRATGALDQATAAFRTQLALAPEDTDSHIEVALTLLLAGDFEAAWPHYERRAAPDPEALSPDRLWDGGDLEGRTILLLAEQGFGDTIQFVRYAELLKAKGAKVLLQVQPGLTSLCGKAPGIDRVFAYGEAQPAHDCKARLLSVPRLLGTRLETIPTRVPYLAAEPERVAAWRAKLAGRPGLKVGIAWQGKPGTPLDHGRSIPLAALAPLTAVPGVRLISLQKHHGRDQIGDLALEDYAEEMDEGPEAFLDTAAIMANLDLVISSDTAIPHLAGALARPVWLLVKKVPEWRWLLGRPDSPWYPTMRLFRQTCDGDWSTVVQQVAGDLTKLAGGDRDLLRPCPSTAPSPRPSPTKGEGRGEGAISC